MVILQLSTEEAQAIRELLTEAEDLYDSLLPAELSVAEKLDTALSDLEAADGD